MDDIVYNFLSEEAKEKRLASCQICEYSINDVCDRSGVTLEELTTYTEFACPENKWNE